MQVRDTACQPLILMHDLGNCVPFTLDAHRGSVMLLQYMILDHRSNILSLYRLVDIRRVFLVDFCRLVSLTVTCLTIVLFGFDLLICQSWYTRSRRPIVFLINIIVRSINKQGLVGHISIKRGQISHGDENISILTLTTARA